MTLLVHQPGCNWQRDRCNCTPAEFTNPKEARAALKGDGGRLQIAAVIPPEPQFKGHVSHERSQARHHRVISY